MAGQFLTVTCRDCGTETVIFDRSVNTISCDVCGATLSPVSYTHLTLPTMFEV